jgi:acetolactate synthase-1/2/3 large subunit
VLVDVPMDIWSRECKVALFERQRLNTKDLHKPTIDDATAEKIVRTLVQAKNPLLHVGGGIVPSGSAAELRDFVDHLSIPVSYSTMGKGALPDDHPFSLGMAGFWGTKFINGKCLEADYILALGTRFAEADSSSWEPGYTFNIPPTKLIHIDIEPSEIGRNFPVEIGVVADLKQALSVLNRVARKLYPEGRKNDALKQEIAANKESFRSQNREHVTSNAYPMRPERILAEVREVLPRDAFITTDVGWNKNGVGQQFPICEPGCVLTPGGFATMGFGAPAALGAKIAAPDRVVVSLVGDGGFGQNPALLATAVEEGIATIWVIMNNNAYGVIAGLEKAHFGTTFGTIFPKGVPDYAAVARAYGAEGVSVQSAEEFKSVLERAVKSNKPFVIDVQMQNVPTPTAGHWNIMDIYSPNKHVHHVVIE